MKKNKRVVTNQEFMEKARKAIERDESRNSQVEHAASAMLMILESLNEILSDGQRQQLERLTEEIRFNL